MEQKPWRKKIWIWLAAALILTPLALLAGVYLLGTTGVSTRYDDTQALLASYDPGDFKGGTLLEDGTASVRLTRKDLYWFARRYGLLDQMEKKIAASGISRWGVRLAQGQLISYLRTHVLGFLPVTFRAEMTLSLEDGDVVLRTEAVHLGRYLPIPKALWPQSLRAPLRFSLGVYARGIRDVHVESGALILTLDGLRTPPPGDLEPDAGQLTAAMALLPASERQTVPALEFLAEREGGAFPAVDAWNYAMDAADPAEALSQVLSLCTESSVGQVLERMDPFPRDVLAGGLSERSGQLRSDMSEKLRTTQNSYERVLSSLREMYKGGALQITQSGFVSAATGETVGPSSLAGLSASATDSRVVFLYSASGGDEVCTEDMPPVSQIPLAPRTYPDPRPDPDTVYDLGAVLTSEGGIPLLLHRQQDGTFVLREIAETLYVSLLVEQAIPVLDTDQLPPPAREILRPAGEGWSGAALLLLSPPGAA